MLSMMRIMGPSCALAVAIAAACAGGTKLDPADASSSTCGDGVCTPQKVQSCPQDCGRRGSQQIDAGSAFLDSGSGSQHLDASVVDAGSGGLVCNDPTVIAACALCLVGGPCNGVTVAQCQACLGG
jgi:hypothetical protein